MDLTQLFASLVFGGIGFVAFVYGKKQADFKSLGIGIALMVYPYFVTSLLWSCIIGVALTALLFVQI